EAVLQAPNRAEVWSRSQRPRSVAMTGPRFEQTDFALQPRPYAAIDLIHQQPVRWTHDRVVACDGGGGPTGHPKIFINTDKPEIATCGYCGLPFANEHHRKHLESLPETSYPL
ncbi:NADH:ubiquinone oxidoreductase 18.4kD subunit, partial [Parathielavia appendiculata]